MKHTAYRIPSQEKRKDTASPTSGKRRPRKTRERKEEKRVDMGKDPEWCDGDEGLGKGEGVGSPGFRY